MESGLVSYPQDRLYKEMAFLAYYLHWSQDDLMNMDHRERRRWCSEISSINRKLSGDQNNTFEFK
ncbi:DUF6760 family protein [Lachnospiraceae bacterium C1.1]